MKLIITGYINEQEIKPLERNIHFEKIKDAARKAASGLGIVMSSALLPKGSSFRKIKIATKEGAFRSLLMVRNQKDDIILVMLREKKDKKVGMNFSFYNPLFEAIVDRNVFKIFEDIESGNYIEYEL